CHWDRHYIAPPHCSLSSPHLYRRKKPENVSWVTTICSSCRWITDRQIGLSPIHQATKMQLFRAKRPACGFCGLVHVSLRKTHAGARASNNLSAVLVILEVITFSVSPPPVFWCRSEERRVGKEGRCGGAEDHER